MIDPCEAIPIMDPSIITSPIDYNVHSLSTATTITLDDSLVSYSPTSGLCPALEIDIVHSDDSPINVVRFWYDKATKIFTINSQDTADTTSSPYSLKIVAGFTGGPKTNSLPF